MVEVTDGGGATAALPLAVELTRERSDVGWRCSDTHMLMLLVVAGACEMCC